MKVLKVMKLVALPMMLTVVATAAFADPPRPGDYAQGIRVDVYAGRPVAEVLLPDAVYQSVTRTDLGDVRVFNADGVAVPHAFCASAATHEPAISRQALPVFELQAPSTQGNGQPGSNGTQVQVETAGGTQVRIQEGQATPALLSGTRTWAHVIDARAVTEELRSIEFDWNSPDGATQADVRVEASDDLDQWRTVVNASTLLRVTQGGQQLQRKVVPLSQRHYDYLRVVRTDGGPPLQIAAVIGERVAQPATLEPVWFTASPQPSAKASELLFDAGRIAPVSYARIVLPQENSSVRVRIQSRPDDQAEWRERWSGEIYFVVVGGERRVSAPAQINAGHDRYWRVVYSEPSDALHPEPALELGYRPAKLRFLAQGAGPFTLAFGSRRAQAAPLGQCDRLLSDVSSKDMEKLIGDASIGASQTLGGDAAFKPLPKRTPVRLVVLWGVLIVAVGLLVAMAASLLKRVNGRQT